MSDVVLCPYCQSPVMPDQDPVTCPDCHQIHHRECWTENGVCTTLGCQGYGRWQSGEPPEQPQYPQEPPVRQVPPVPEPDVAEVAEVAAALNQHSMPETVLPQPERPATGRRPSKTVALGVGLALLLLLAAGVYRHVMVTPLSLPEDQQVTTADLTLFGQTAPGAAVTINGEPISVLPDGRFPITYNFAPTFTGRKQFEVVATKPFRSAAKGTVQVDRRLPQLKLTAAPSEAVVTGRTVIISGQTEPGAVVRINLDEVTATSDGSYAYLFTFPPGFQGLKGFSIMAEREGYLSDSTSVTVLRQPPESEIRDAFAVGAQRTFPYREVMKSPSRYSGTKVIFWGRILQIQESNGTTFMLVYVTPLGYGVWQDIVAVDYRGATNFLDGDQVEVYGTIQGDLFTYDTKGGWINSVPAVSAVSFGDKFWR